MCLCDSTEHRSPGAKSTPYSCFQCKKILFKKLYAQLNVKLALTQCASCPMSYAVCNFEFGNEITYRKFVLSCSTLMTVVDPCEDLLMI
jgi:hypothetical protein